MNTDLLRAGQPLLKGGLFRIHNGQGRRVECLAGCLWLTQEHDPRDVILEAGEGFTIDRAGDTFLSALGDSSYVVLDAVKPVADAQTQKPAKQPARAY